MAHGRQFVGVGHAHDHVGCPGKSPRMSQARIDPTYRATVDYLHKLSNVRVRWESEP